MTDEKTARGLLADHFASEGNHWAASRIRAGESLPMSTDAAIKVFARGEAKAGPQGEFTDGSEFPGRCDTCGGLVACPSCDAEPQEKSNNKLSADATEDLARELWRVGNMQHRAPWSEVARGVKDRYRRMARAAQAYLLGE